jgi:hypothetical protein
MDELWWGRRARPGPNEKLELMPGKLPASAYGWPQTGFERIGVAMNRCLPRLVQADFWEGTISNHATTEFATFCLERTSAKIRVPLLLPRTGERVIYPGLQPD